MSVLTCRKKAIHLARRRLPGHTFCPISLGCETERSLYPSRLVHSTSPQPAPRHRGLKPKQRVAKRPPQESDGLDVTMEPATGLEPATGSLQNCYATIASCRHTKMRVESLYDNNPDSQSLSHKRYNHHRQDIAGHVTRPHVRKRGCKTPLPSVLAPFAEPSFHVRHCSCEQKHRWS